MSENMLFCLGEGSSESQGIGYQKSFMVFNKQLTGKEYREVKSSFPTIEIPVARWINKDNMSKEEKKNVSGWDEMGGYLKTLGYEEGWEKWWGEAKQEDKNKILNCEYFDAKVFAGITGLKDFATKNLKGKVVKVEIDGEKYEATIN